jgi:D-tagatose-1,6-bisphosphate aldolase subunit GatZ/KbaZ
MMPLGALVHRIIELQEAGPSAPTLLAVCPNSAAVLEAAILSAARANAPMLFAATLNQVDLDGGYTGWTQAQFVAALGRIAATRCWSGPLYPCLDHGGPWLKDAHAPEGLGLAENMRAVKASLTAALAAGYRLLHIDPTVDRTLPAGEPVPIGLVVDRTVELMVHAETERRRLRLPLVDYEVGTEEVHGGLVDLAAFEAFVARLHRELGARDLLTAWPVFIVAKVGTDLHTTTFDSATASHLRDLVAPYGSLIKGHYTDWVAEPAAYPASGMGGANVGPEFTAVEVEVLEELVAREAQLSRCRSLVPSGFIDALQSAVEASGRWRKWLQPGEQGHAFDDLTEARRTWLTQTGARYVWTAPTVLAARRRLYDNLSLILADPHQVVVERIAAAIDRYMIAFNLVDSLSVGGAFYGNT